MPGEGLDRLAVQRVLRGRLELVERAGVEVQEGAPRGAVCVQACDAGGYAGLEVARRRLDGREEAEGPSHGGLEGFQWLVVEAGKMDLSQVAQLGLGLWSTIKTSGPRKFGR